MKTYKWLIVNTRSGAVVREGKCEYQHYCDAEKAGERVWQRLTSPTGSETESELSKFEVQVS